MQRLSRNDVLRTNGGAIVSTPTVLADRIPGVAIRDVVLVAGSAGLMGLLAQISVHIPGTPVPITAQTLGVLVVGTALGSKRGLAAMLLYAVVGVLGVRWFAAGTSGFSASFGYIVGFIVAAGLCGRLAEMGTDRKLISSVPAMIAGELVMYVIGVGWLAIDLHIGISRAITLGFTPFWIGDALKCALAAALLPGAWKLVGSREER